MDRTVEGQFERSRRFLSIPKAEAAPFDVLLDVYLRGPESDMGIPMSERGPVVAAARVLVQAFHPNPDDPDVNLTPERIVEALAEMTRGLKMDPEEILSAQFDAHGYDNVVALANIRFHSLCEHHFQPFSGTAGVAYLPALKGPIVGLSKLARLVDCFACRPQTQERMTEEIADALMLHLNPRGVAVVVEGVHSCMTVRGVQKEGAVMVTSSMRGAFRENAAIRSEVLSLLKGRA